MTKHKINFAELAGITLLAVIASGISACGGNTTASDNTDKWQQLGSDFQTSNVILKSLAISPTGDIFSGGSFDVYNGGVAGISLNSNWQIAGGGYIPNNYTPGVGTFIKQISSIAVANNILYAAVNVNYQLSVIYKTSGSNWIPVVPALVPDYGIVNSITADSSDHVYAATAVNNMSNNTYAGNVFVNESDASWSQIGGGSLPDGGVANAVALAHGALYVASGGPNVNLSNAYVGDVYSSTYADDVWQAWQLVGGGSMPDSGVPTALAAGSQTANIIYAATAKGDVYSSNRGIWQQVGQGSMPDDSAINSIAVIESNPDVIFAATAKGNVYGAKIGSSWQLIGGSNMPDGWFINSIALYKNQIYAATQGGHVYYTNIQD